MKAESTSTPAPELPIESEEPIAFFCRAQQRAQRIAARLRKAIASAGQVAQSVASLQQEIAELSQQAVKLEQEIEQLRTRVPMRPRGRHVRRRRIARMAAEPPTGTTVE